MTWQELWTKLFADPPADRSSREVSVQEILAVLVAGEKCDWFEPYTPGSRGRSFLEAMWRAAFVDAGKIDWFVSEYPLPVPPEWRDEIRYTYRCPDLACGNDERVLIVELKTERGSYSRQQMIDYLRLARHKLPDAATDVVLLAPHRPGATPALEDRQRYGELTWFDVPLLLSDSFPGDHLAEALSTFLLAELAATGAVSTPSIASPTSPNGPTGTNDLRASAVFHAQRMAPSVAVAKPGDRVERGINVAFPSLEVARLAQADVTRALTDSDFERSVSVWLWQPGSGGNPTTPAGRAVGRELRLAPKRATD